MSLKKHAERELKLAGFFDKDSDYGGELGKAVMELINVFSKQGHSGFSASSVIRLFSKVANYKPLIELTGKDDEWGDNLSPDSESKQNNRLGSVFKDDDGKAYYLDAIVWQGQESFDTFTGTVNGISSRQYIKSFPFYPKTFYIDVVREKFDSAKHDEKEYEIVECGPGKMAYKIKDTKQLDEVFEYYNKYNK